MCDLLHLEEKLAWLRRAMGVHLQPLSYGGHTPLVIESRNSMDLVGDDCAGSIRTPFERVNVLAKLVRGSIGH